MIHGNGHMLYAPSTIGRIIFRLGNMLLLQVEGSCPYRLPRPIPSRIPESPSIMGMNNSSTAVTGLCVVFRLVELVYVIDADADGGVCVGGGGGCSCVLVEVRTETEMATDALIDGHPVSGLIIALRSL